MSWIIYALLANVFFGASVLLDKFLNTKKIKHVYSFAILLNAVYFIFVLITTLIQRESITWGPGIIYSGIAGIFWFFMWIFFWKALQTGEATRVSAIYFSQPIYAALIGTLLFHEPLSGLKWIGIFVIVTGAMLSALGGKGNKKGERSAYFFAFLAALFSSIGISISKYAMLTLSPITVNSLAFYSTIPLYLFLLKEKTVFKEVMGAFKDKILLLQFGMRGFFGYMGIILFMMAVGSGPMSLVTAVSGTQPLFILVFSLLVSALYPKLIHEDFGKKALIQKSIALLFTVLGIILISR